MTRSLAILALALLGACGQGTTEPSDTFIAYSNAFAPFMTWSSYQDTLADDGSLPAGVGGPRTQYLNKLPPHGATEFPVGTIIVEAREDGKYFASVKRGGDFNPSGSLNWEFFEIGLNPVTITWRGLGPPLGDTYGGDPNGCNNCHDMCASNDYICSPKLQLTSF